MAGLLSDSTSIAQLIQTATAPVFLLNGLAILLTVFAGRLARLVDRMRRAADLLREGMPEPRADVLRRELAFQRRRMGVVNAAIALAALSAFLTCCAVLTLFIGALSQAAASPVPVVLFAVAVATVIAALALFLVEVYISGQALRAEVADLLD
jgi:hypothetical protein